MLPIVDCGAGNEAQDKNGSCYSDDDFVYELFSGTGEEQVPADPKSTGGNCFYVDVPGHPIHHEFRDECWIQKWTHPGQQTYISNVIKGKTCP
jgi:hypothetical protein